MLEYEDRSQRGVAQLTHDAWGATLAPLDEQLPWLRIRRSLIEEVRANEGEGTVEVTLGLSETASPGVSVGRSSGGLAGELSGRTVRLLGLGRSTRIHGDRLAGLQAEAQGDAGRLIAALIPDASYGARQEAARTLIDGHPARPADLPLSWLDIEAGVLVDPTFASSYAQLRSKSAQLAEHRSIAISPMAPGADEARSWFLVPLPGNLVALELVSAGAHATYCFRVQPRAEFARGSGEPGPLPAVPTTATTRATTTATMPTSLRAAVAEISQALVESRFLREPMALPDEVLRQPDHLRYRLALEAIPSLAAARARFVARIVHRDDASWAAALDDLIAWHGGARDDAAVWPGRSTEEAMVEETELSDDSDPMGVSEGHAEAGPAANSPPPGPTAGGR
jgi:hypothetical protein